MTTPPTYITVAECAELLRSTPKAVKRMVDKGKLPGIRRLPGFKKLLIHRASVVAWIESGASPHYTRGSV